MEPREGSAAAASVFNADGNLGVAPAMVGHRVYSAFGLCCKSTIIFSSGFCRARLRVKVRRTTKKWLLLSFVCLLQRACRAVVVVLVGSVFSVCRGEGSCIS